jgi:hypothetical protein
MTLTLMNVTVVFIVATGRSGSTSIMSMVCVGT